MAAPKAKLVGGSAAKDVTLDAEIFGAEVKPHLVHETVRAELNARRAGTRGAKTRGLVSGGRAKPWRQKGTGRARAGTIRAPQFTGGGVVFAPTMRSFDVKVNRKARRSALRGALSNHASNGTLGILDGSGFEAPSTKQAKGLVESWGKDAAAPDRRHRGRGDADQVVPQPAEDARDGAVRARGRHDRLGAERPRHRGRAAARRGEGFLMSLHPNEVLLAPVVSEKSYSLITDRKYTFKVHKNAHKTQIRQAVEELFEVHVENVNILKVQAKPKRRGVSKGTRPGWKKAIVQVREGETIEIFEGAQV